MRWSLTFSYRPLRSSQEWSNLSKAGGPDLGE